MIGSRVEAQRLSKLAAERYAAYSIHGARVVLTVDGFMLVVGDLSTTFRTAAACEQIIMDFGTRPLLEKSERAPF